MRGILMKNKKFFIILSLLIIIGILVACTLYQNSNEIPSKGVFVMRID
ncbi:hypothetical protein RBH29_06745 [Herbivorax sp. ANBcel31]|nr:hypothetical protein [Herbivorax sp. ANBcel31]MDQ2086131.1 hypothetical protein [Herbivorax sp. ANBcel31]